MENRGYNEMETLTRTLRVDEIIGNKIENIMSQFCTEI